MDFSIEVPGEANPLTIENLYQTLISANSFDQQQLKSSAKQLQNWEKHPGYYSSLQSIFIDTSLSTEIRYQAVIQLKNGIDKYWRKASPNAIAGDEKSQIRSRCLVNGFNEPDHRLALHNALSIAKIFRHDYPHDWPQAFQEIIAALRLASIKPESSLRIFRALLIFLHMIKVISSAPLIRNRANIQRDASKIFEPLRGIYLSKVTVWRTFLENGGGDEGGALDSIEQSLLSLRILRRLLIAAYDFPHRHIEVQEFWIVLGTQLGQMLTLVLQRESFLDLIVKRLIGKHVVQMAKLHLDMARTHPKGFALLPDPAGLACTYWEAITHLGESFGSQTASLPEKIGHDGDAEADEIPVLESISLKGLLLIRACVKMVYDPTHSFKFQRDEDKAERKRSQEVIKQSLLTGKFACEMMETLVTRFFVFRLRDLREWEEEPEEWERREEGEGDVWEFSIRSCAEKLFLDLVIHYKDLLTQPLLAVFSKVATIHNRDILLKDSLYAAIGLAAQVLDQKLDFGTFLASTLVPEVQIQQSGYNILRRRTAIILGQWLPLKEGLDRPLVYQIFQHLLNKDDPINDQVVRVTAGRQFKHVVEPFEFTADLFMPYAPPILGSLMQLIEEVELGETKMALLGTISVIIVNMGHHISPFADHIISLLPPLWAQAGDIYLMKQYILSILSELVEAMGGDSQRYHQMIIPIIESAVEPSSETRLYLLEDAMELWATILVQTPLPASQEIGSLAKYLFPMYESVSDTLRKALEMTEIYIYLMPEHYLSVVPALLSPLVPLLSTTKPEAAFMITSLAELLIRTAEYSGGTQAVADLTTQLVSTKFLPTLLTGLESAYNAHQTTGPNRESTVVHGIVETGSFSVLARLALTSPPLFISALEAAIPHDTLETTISWLLMEWFSHFENIGDPVSNKLSCLALTALLETNQPWILSRLQELMTIWTEVITDLIDSDSGADSLVYWDIEALKGPEPEAPSEERRRQLAYADPVRRYDTKAFVRQKLEGVVATCGGRDIFEQNWLVNVDADVVQAFGKLGVV